MGENLHLFINGQQLGPYSEPQAKAMYLAGTINAETLYWNDGMDEWQPIDLLFASSLATSKTSDDASTVDSQPNESSREDKAKANPWIVLAIIVGCAVVAYVVGFYPNVPNPVLLVSGSRTAHAMPIELEKALNDIKSATETGTKQETYANLVIALKSESLTYGANLSEKENSKLKSIVSNYDLANELWKKSRADDIGFNTTISEVSLDLGDDRDRDLASRLKVLGVEPTDASKDDFKHQLYLTDITLSKIWAVNESNISILATFPSGGS